VSWGNGVAFDPEAGAKLSALFGAPAGGDGGNVVPRRRATGEPGRRRSSQVGGFDA
jgi:hypothetical protein